MILMAQILQAPAISRPLRRVSAYVLIGTTIEGYKVILYGSAAVLVFGPLFFPPADPDTGTLLAFSTFAARPLGRVILGHFGDKLDRKRVLVLSLTMMGITTFVIGLLPTYASIGAWVPILLVLLRLIQGPAAARHDRDSWSVATCERSAQARISTSPTLTPAPTPPRQAPAPAAKC